MAATPTNQKSEQLLLNLEQANLKCKQAEDALRDSERKYSHFLQNAPLPYQSLDQNGDFLEVNDHLLLLLGYTREELIGKSFGNLLHPDSVAHFKQNFPKFKAAGEILGVEFEMMKKDGTTIFVAFNGKIQKDDLNNFQRTHCIFQDITERKKNLAQLINSTEELKKSQERFDYAMEASQDGLYDWDLKTNDIYYSPGWKRMLGYRVNELPDDFSVWEKLTHSEDIEKAWEMQKALINKTLDRFELEFKMQHKDGHWVDILSRAKAIFDNNGDAERIVGTHVDITEQKKAEKEKETLKNSLHQAQKLEAVGTLTGGIAHDFNNILAAILGFADLISNQVPPNSLMGQDIKEIITSAERGADLVKRLLTYSRQTGRTKRNLSPHLILKEALQILQATLPTSISIDTDLDTHSGTVLIDATSLHQIIINLCNNAAQSMPDKIGILSIHLCHNVLTSADIPAELELPPGPYFVFSIRDNGTGMDEATKNRIFEPYFTTKEMGSGTGLGLAIVHGIVSDCKGFIKVDSVVGIGSTFRIYLPASEKLARENSIIKENKTHSVQGKMERILIVDDDPLLTAINERRLTDNGYQVSGFTNSKEALKYFLDNSKSFDLVITDQTMPGLTGAELTKEIIKVRPELPVIICTGHSETVPEERALSLGIKKYVYKPIKDDDLLVVIREVLDMNS